MFLLKPITVEGTEKQVYGAVTKVSNGKKATALYKIAFRGAVGALTRWCEVSWCEHVAYTERDDQTSKYLVITEPECASGGTHAECYCVRYDKSPLEIIASNGKSISLRQYEIQQGFRSQALKSLDTLMIEGTEQEDEDLRVTTYDTKALENITELKGADLTMQTTGSNVNIPGSFRIVKYRVNSIPATVSVLGFAQNEAGV